ncbi:MAG: hypothetical protein ACRD0M_13415, partial [Acidimicrobiales bacterium]
PRARRLTARSVAFVVAVVVVIAAAAGAIGWYARAPYFVGLDGQQVVVYQGRPGGLLWFQPTVERRTTLSAADILDSRRATLQQGKTHPSVTAALRYVDNLQIEATQARSAGAPTTPTTAPGSIDYP